MGLSITLMLIGLGIQLVAFSLVLLKGTGAILDSKYEEAHKWTTFNSIISTSGFYLILAGWLVGRIEGSELIWVLIVAFALTLLAFFHGRNQGSSKSNLKRWRENNER